VAREAGLRGALAGARRVVILGVGQELEGDDGAGMEIARLFRRLRRAQGAALGRAASRRRPVARTILAGVAPENATLALRRFRPTHAVFVDAAELGLTPGQWRVIATEEIGGVTFSTHMLPLHILARFIASDLGCHVVVVGIEPRRLSYGEGLTPEVRRGARNLAGSLVRALGPTGPGASGAARASGPGRLNKI